MYRCTHCEQPIPKGAVSFQLLQAKVCKSCMSHYVRNSKAVAGNELPIPQSMDTRDTNEDLENMFILMVEQEAVIMRVCASVDNMELSEIYTYKRSKIMDSSDNCADPIELMYRLELLERAYTIAQKDGPLTDEMIQEYLDDAPGFIDEETV